MALARDFFLKKVPILDKPLHELWSYQGTNPKPPDLEDYWAEALAELDSIDPAPSLEPSREFSCRCAEAFDLWFTSVGGSKIYAKVFIPRQADGPHPAVLEFHGYSGSSGDWSDKIKYAAEGMVVAAMDCRGQGGRSEDRGGVKGNTLYGHIIRGLESGPRHLLFRSIFLDCVQLARVVRAFPSVRAEAVMTTGASQGGGLAIACAALDSAIVRCVSVFPFLSDYQRVWEMDLAKNAYAELRDYFRRFDPLHLRERDVFQTLGYIDVHHLAPRVKAQVLMGLSLMDDICPPSTQFAVFNALKCPKQALIYPDFAHESLPGFADQALRFLTQRI